MLVDFIVRNQVAIREGINGALMISCLWCSAICAFYMIQTWNEEEDKQLGGRVACALAWVFAFEAFRTGSIWYIYYAFGGAEATVPSFEKVPSLVIVGYILGGIGEALAILMCTHLFSPPRQSAYLWKLSLANIVIFLIAADVAQH